MQAMRVALFATCLVDALFPDAGKATVQILERLGQTIEFPLEQTCGQMHANSGYFEPKLVRRYIDTFNECDAIVVPSGSCAGAIRHQHVMIARAAQDDAAGSRSFWLPGRVPTPPLRLPPCAPR
jgi:L-lactate dehydrogenase complex protein LldE